MIALPIFLQMVLEYNAMERGPLARAALAQHVRGRARRREEGRQAEPGKIIRAGFLLLVVGVAVLIPIVPHAHSGWALVLPLIVAGSGLGLLVSQLNNYTLSPIEEERVSEAAGVNSAGGSFGLAFGLAFAGAIMLASLSLVFTHMATSSTVLSPSEQHQVATALEKNAEVMSNTHLEELLAGQAAPTSSRRSSASTRRRADRAPDRAARPAARGAARARHRLPDDAAPRSRAVGRRREHARRLTSRSPGDCDTAGEPSASRRSSDRAVRRGRACASRADRALGNGPCTGAGVAFPDAQAVGARGIVAEVAVGVLGDNDVRRMCAGGWSNGFRQDSTIDPADSRLGGFGSSGESVMPAVEAPASRSV